MLDDLYEIWTEFVACIFAKQFTVISLVHFLNYNNQFIVINPILK